MILALSGLGTIWFITKRSKCVVPTTSNGCPVGQTYYCPSSDAQATCADVNTVCGKWPDGFDYDHCTSIDCTYDSNTSKYKWFCNGSGSGGGSIPKGSPCTIKDGNLDQKTLKGTSLEDNRKPASNSISYFHDTTYNGCRLDTCEKGYDPFPSDSPYLCIPHGMLNVQNTACTNYVSDNDYYTGPNNNFDWVNTYIDPKVYGGSPLLVCKENSCEGDIDKTKKPYTCNRSDPGVCPNYPIGGTSHIASWENLSGIGCRIKSCDGQGEWVVPDDKDPDVTGTGVGPANTARCHPNCTINVPEGSILSYDRTTNTCKVTSCVSGWKLNGDHCEPDCTTSDNITKFLFKGVTPISGFTYKAKAVKDSSTGNWICVPLPYSQSNPFGGCGDATHSAYAPNTSDGTATFCQATINGNTAKFNGTNQGTLGCLACQPRVCPPWATTLSQCVGDVENDCGYTSELVVAAENTPVETCISQNSNRQSIWRTFGSYNQQAVYNDPAAYNKGSAINTRKTAGAPLNYTNWRLIIKGDGTNDNHVDPYTSNLRAIGDTLEIKNFTESNDEELTFWSYLSIGYDSGKATMKVSDIYKCIRDNYINNVPDTTGDPIVTIYLKSSVDIATAHLKINYITLGSRTFNPPLVAPLNFYV